MIVSPAPPSPVASAPSTPSSSPGSTPTARAIVGLRKVLSGTPGRLRVAGAVSVAACLLFGLAAFGAVRNRSNAIADVRSHAAQLVRIQDIRSNATQADAAATNAFLVGGLEPADERKSYNDGIAGATADIAAASAGSTSDAAVLAKTNQVLAKYVGLMESARADNRQGFPIGAAYLRQASNLLRTEALPALAQAVAVEQERITKAYGNAARAENVLVASLVLTVAVLLFVQVWLSFKMRRLLNENLVVATAIVVVGGVIGIGLMTLAEHSATDVRSGSLANTIALATARTDAFDAKSAESLTLINRGSGQPFEVQYQGVINDASAALSGISGRAPASAPIAALRTYETAHRLVRTRDDAGDWDGAVRLATTADPRGTKTTFAAFDSVSRGSLSGQASHGADGLSSARRPLGVTAVLLLIAGIAAAVLAWRGVAARLREYR
jgi:hypothetical protein